MRLTRWNTFVMTNAYYAECSCNRIFKGEPMDLIVSGNNLNVPTAYWRLHQLNSSCSQTAAEEPNKTCSSPNTVSAQVTNTKNLVSVEETTEKPKTPGTNNSNRNPTLCAV